MKITEEHKKYIKYGIIILFIAIIIINLGKAFATPDTGSKPFLKDQVVEGLSFENADLKFENGITTFTVEVHNDQSKDYNLKLITIEFKDSKGTIINKLTSYIGDTIKSETNTNLKASIDEEISNVSNITYIIQK